MRSGYRERENTSDDGGDMAGREKIGEGKNARYVRRDEDGQFTSDQTNVGRSSATDQRRDAKHTSKRGEGDRGDRR
jgi:hypothetical protein